ncbi:MAG: iron hydrogenase small subunit [Thermosyntropha sp.]|nr:iron hydrogenase small subunit [Thermosyntropha sp.]
MNIFVERGGITRRQFFKGTGIIAATAVFAGILGKIGIDIFKASDKYIEKRIAGLYTLDERMTIRKSHENPEIIQIYKEFLSPGEVKPLTEKSHHLLHTKYGSEIPELIKELEAHRHHAA